MVRARDRLRKRLKRQKPGAVKQETHISSQYAATLLEEKPLESSQLLKVKQDSSKESNLKVEGQIFAEIDTNESAKTQSYQQSPSVAPIRPFGVKNNDDYCYDPKSHFPALNKEYII